MTSSSRVPVAAPPRVAARLAVCPDGPVRILHATPQLVHLDIAGGAVAVAARGAPGLPHALRSNLAAVFVRGSSAALPTAYVESGILRLGGRALVIGRLVDVRAPRLGPAWVSQTSPAFAQGTPRSRVAGLVADLVAMVGLGEGLTPLGDDVLCGWLAAHRAAGVATPELDVALRRALSRSTTLSATLLECALAGEVADLAAGYLRALATPRAEAARAALTTLGHSSGAGLADGVDLALGALARGAAA